MARRSINGSRMLITGASSGICRALAEEAARAGAKVALVGRNNERLNQVAERIRNAGGTALPIVADVTVPQDRQRMLEQTVRAFGGLDILVNNAGIGATGHFFRAAEQRLRTIMEVNFFAVAETTRAAIPLLQQGRRPMVVNIGSVLGRRAVPARSEYCASKFALTGLSESLRAEFVRFGIDLLLVQPGLTDTPFEQHMLENRAVLSLHSARRMPAEKLARIIIRAIERGKKEVVTTVPGKLFVWLNRLFPRLVDCGNALFARIAIRREQRRLEEQTGQQDQAADPHNPTDRSDPSRQQDQEPEKTVQQVA